MPGAHWVSEGIMFHHAFFRVASRVFLDSFSSGKPVPWLLDTETLQRRTLIPFSTHIDIPQDSQTLVEDPIHLCTRRYGSTTACKPFIYLCFTHIHPSFSTQAYTQRLPALCSSLSGSPLLTVSEALTPLLCYINMHPP